MLLSEIGKVYDLPSKSNEINISKLQGLKKKRNFSKERVKSHKKERS